MSLSWTPSNFRRKSLGLEFWSVSFSSIWDSGSSHLCLRCPRAPRVINTKLCNGSRLTRYRVSKALAHVAVASKSISTIVRLSSPRTAVAKASLSSSDLQSAFFSIQIPHRKSPRAVLHRTRLDFAVMRIPCSRVVLRCGIRKRSCSFSLQNEFLQYIIFSFHISARFEKPRLFCLSTWVSLFISPESQVANSGSIR